EEIAKRLESGYSNVILYLLKEGYMDVFDKNEIMASNYFNILNSITIQENDSEKKIEIKFQILISLLFFIKKRYYSRLGYHFYTKRSSELAAERTIFLIPKEIKAKINEFLIYSFKNEGFITLFSDLLRILKGSSILQDIFPALIDLIPNLKKRGFIKNSFRTLTENLVMKNFFIIEKFDYVLKLYKSYPKDHVELFPIIINKLNRDLIRENHAQIEDLFLNTLRSIENQYNSSQFNHHFFNLIDAGRIFVETNISVIFLIFKNLFNKMDKNSHKRNFLSNLFKKLKYKDVWEKIFIDIIDLIKNVEDNYLKFYLFYDSLEIYKQHEQIKELVPYILKIIRTMESVSDKVNNFSKLIKSVEEGQILDENYDLIANIYQELLTNIKSSADHQNRINNLCRLIQTSKNIALINNNKALIEKLFSSSFHNLFNSNELKIWTKFEVSMTVITVVKQNDLMSKEFIDKLFLFILNYLGRKKQDRITLSYNFEKFVDMLYVADFSSQVELHFKEILRIAEFLIVTDYFSFSRFFNFIEHTALKEKKFAEILQIFNKIPSNYEKMEALSLIIENSRNIRLITHHHHLINKSLSDLLKYAKKKGTLNAKLVMLKVINDKEKRRQLLLEDILKNDYVRSEWVLDDEFYDDDAYPRFIDKQIRILSSFLESIKGTDLLRNHFDDLLNFINQSYDFGYKIKAVKKLYDAVKSSELFEVKYYNGILRSLHKIIDNIKGIQKKIIDWMNCGIQVHYSSYRLNLFSELFKQFKETEFMKEIFYDLLKSTEALGDKIVEGFYDIFKTMKGTKLLEEHLDVILNCIKRVKRVYDKRQILLYFLKYIEDQKILKEKLEKVINLTQELDNYWYKLELLSKIINSINEFKDNNEVSKLMEYNYYITENFIQDSLNYLHQIDNVWFVFDDPSMKDGPDSFDPIINRVKNRIDKFFNFIYTVKETKFMKKNYELIKEIFLGLVNSLEKEKYWEKLGKDIYWEMLKEDFELIKIVFESYFNEPEAQKTLFVVLDLFKQHFNEGNISKQLSNRILTIISEFYIDNFNWKEMENFLNSSSYSNKDKIVFPPNNGSLIKYLTFLLLIHIYTYVFVDFEVENIFEKEIKKILIYASQNRSDEARILSLFKNLDLSLDKLNTKDFFYLILNRKSSIQQPDINHNQTSLLTDFFIGYFITKKRPVLSKSKAKEMLADLKK
ncbi:MAG: hypothetical protein ACFFA6_12815, partial [Promethearchaeota archaeon]